MTCLLFWYAKGAVFVEKILMKNDEAITFEEGCNLYLLNCKERNLRQATINHYRQSYTQFYKYFDRRMPLSEMNESKYTGYVLHLREELENDVSINSYLRDLIATMRFLMNAGHVKPFQMKTIKVDKWTVETYTEEELGLLLKKPNVKACGFLEYECWVMTNFLFSTGVRQRSLIHIRIGDIDLENGLVHVRVTKSRKPLVIPINKTMQSILREYLRHRQYKKKDEFLFCNAYGEQLGRSSHYKMLASYNKSRGVETTGVHRYRHTFAKQWILNGGNVVSLSKMLGHSNLSITQNYINLLVTDLAKQVEEINLLDKFAAKKRIKI